MIQKNPMKHMALIPARIHSTRLIEKPLQKINNKPLVQCVVEKVLETNLFEKVVVATDSEKILEALKKTSVEVVLTSPDHESGTDRIFEAITKLKFDIESLVNIQGDEPFVYKEDLKNLLFYLEEGYSFCSLYSDIKPEEINDSSKVKVILNEKSEAIYFSRYGIPFSREKALELDSKYIGKHIGVYGYRKKFLEKFCKQGVGYFEMGEKLEQLRALQMGEKIKMFYTKNAYYGVDTEEDLKEVNRMLSGKN